MLDGQIRKRLDPWLDSAGRTLARRGVGADAVTIAGFLIGVAAACAIAFDALGLAFLLILASRLCDGLDGAVARATGKTDFGGFLDIVLDFAFYGLIPFAFVLAHPQDNAVAGGLLILAFYVNGASFLAFAVMAEKRGMTSEVRGAKSLYFTTGLAEATETIAVFLAFCIFPGWFFEIAVGFALICAYTTLSRIVLARASFSQRS